MDEHDHDHNVEEMIFRQQVSELENQLVALENRRSELEIVKQSITDMKHQKDREIMIPVGAGVMILGKIVDEKNILVNIGANVVVPRTSDEAKKLIEEQLDEINKLQDSLKKELERFM